MPSCLPAGLRTRHTVQMAAALALIIAAVAAVPLAVAQDFPAPGTGTFTWQRIGPDPVRMYPDRFKP